MSLFICFSNFSKRQARRGDIKRELKEYTDKGLADDAWVLKKVGEESIRQIVKGDIQTHPLFEWLAYAVEELGELAKAITEYEYREGTRSEIVKEAVQVATLALKIAEMIEGEINEKKLRGVGGVPG